MSVTIVLDTNAVYSDPALRGASIGRLLAMSRRHLIQLVIPQVVLDELRRQRSEVITNQTRVLEVMPTKAAVALRELGVTAAQLSMTVPVVPAVDPDRLLAAYTDEVTRRLEDNLVTTAPLPDETVPALYARDLAGRRPFDSQGKGFRDALIWATVVRLCEVLDPDDTVYMVTNDHHSVQKALRRELLDEISPDAATLAHARDLDDLLGRPDLSESRLAIQQIVDSLGEEPGETASVSAERGVSSALGELVNRTLDDNEQRQLDVPEELYDVAITKISDLREFSWNAYDEFNNTTVLGQAYVVGDLQLEGTCDASDVEDLDWYLDDDFALDTEDEVRYTVTLKREAALLFDVRVELLSGSADQVDFEGFQPV